MAEQECSRRRLLSGLVPALAALAGCGGAGTETDTLTSGGVAGAGGGVGAGGDGGDGGTATPTPTTATTATTTSTSDGGTADANDTNTTTTTAATTAATPAIQTATAPPGDAVEVENVDLRLRRRDYYTVADADITLHNVGAYVFSRLELRVDLYYHPIGDDRRRVADTYVERADFDGDDDEDDDTRTTFGPDDTVTLSPDDLRFRRDGRAGGSTDPADFEIDIEFRRVEYRPA